MEKSNDEELEEYTDELYTGIIAIDRTYIFDSRVKELLEAFEKSIDYIKKHTDLSEAEIKDAINQTIYQIEFKDGYPENPNGVGYVDTIFKLLSVNLKVLKETPEYIYEFIRHEMTHMIGGREVKVWLKKNPIVISGYSRESVYDENSKEDFESFNEAAVEMFVNQDEEYKEEKIFDYTINTNQGLNGGLYCLNSNLIHQMLMAGEIGEKEFFKGLYDYKKSKQVIGKFRKTIFKKLSTNMDIITQNINDYYDVEDEICDLPKNDESSYAVENRMKMQESKKNLEDTISSSERMIIDKILLPKLKRVPLNERQQILDEYYKFIISEKEYFRVKTKYRAVADVGKHTSSCFKHIDVEPLDMNKVSKASLRKERDREE